MRARKANSIQRGLTTNRDIWKSVSDVLIADERLECGVDGQDDDSSPRAREITERFNAKAVENRYKNVLKLFKIIRDMETGTGGNDDFYALTRAEIKQLKKRSVYKELPLTFDRVSMKATLFLRHLT